MKTTLLAVCILFTSLLSQISLSASFEEINQKAIAGDMNSQNELGKRFLKGVDVNKDEDKAFMWFQKSALQGNAKAQNNVGLFYLYGISVKKDINLALQWLEKASNQGLSIADYNLGHNYLFGFGVEQNIDKALMYLIKSAQKSNIEAQYYLGEYYFKQKDFNKAKLWLSLVLENKESPAMPLFIDIDYKKETKELLAKINGKK